MIQLYHGGPSGHSASMLICAAEKGLRLDLHAVDLAAFEQHRPALLALNPAGQVPVLRDGDRILTEAFFILLYLDEAYPEPGFGGRDPLARYAVQKWGKYVETHLAPQLAILGWAEGGARPDAAARAGFAALTPERAALWEQAVAGFPDEDVTAARAAVEKGLGRIAADLAEAEWLAGADYSIADMAVFPHAARAAALGIPLPPRVAGWLADISARPAVRAALGETGLPAELATMGPERGRWG